MSTYLLKALPHVGPIVVWGDNSRSQIKDAPTNTDFNEIAFGGGFNSLAIRKDGMLVLWGDPALGRLPWTVPGAPASAYWGPSVDAVVSLSHLAAILTDRLVVHSGHFLKGGDATPPPGLRAKSVALTADWNVAIDMAGNLVQWGTGPGGAPLESPPAGKFEKVSARGDYAVALRHDGQRIYGWGNTYFASWPGWTKDGSSNHYYVDGSFTDVAAGAVWKDPAKVLPNQPHVSGLNADGSVTGWGTNFYGETTDQPGPLKAIAAGLSYSIGLDADGHIHQWGASGTGTPPSGQFISIGAGARHATAVRVA